MVLEAAELGQQEPVAVEAHDLVQAVGVASEANLHIDIFAGGDCTSAQVTLDASSTRGRWASEDEVTTPMESVMSSTVRRLKLRRPDTCAVCATSLNAGEVAIWDAERRHTRCIGCEPVPPLPEPPSERSEAGASAQREYERRRANREARVRERFGSLGGVVLAVSGEPQHQRAWARGAEGEVKLACKLEKWTAEHGVVLLHDRRMPTSRGNSQNRESAESKSPGNNHLTSTATFPQIARKS